ncbi:MAG: GMC family oxidoreductase [Nitrososphaerota archaeon]|nr:GMC family oxidoreductase [Nitrososphaerota archaeon]
MAHDFDAIIIGSGAGGGPVAWQLTQAGKKVAIIETGGFYTTNDFTRFELLALRNLWWKPRWTSNYELGLEGEIGLGMGRCVGGSTTIFTAVAKRAPPFNFKEWYEASKPRNERGERLSAEDLEPFYQQVEKDTGVRKYTEWDEGLKKIDAGFRKLGHPWSPVYAYISSQCDQSGCLYGCPTEAKKGSLVTYIIPAVLLGAQIFYNSTVTKILFSKGENGEKPRAEGVEYTNEAGEKKRITSRIVIVAAGALNTPLLLLDSGIEEVAGHSKSVEQIGRNFGVNTATMVFGRFDDVLNNWIMHPLSGQMDDFAQKEKGGFLLEGSEVMEGPLSFAELMQDEDGLPLWGERQKKIMENYGHYAGIFINIHDANDGRIFRDPETGQDKYYKPVTSEDKARFKAAKALSREGLYAAGAKDTLDSAYVSHHVQGSCRMGEDVSKSVVNSHCESHDVENLYVMDGSVIPSVIDSNPSLTIMALSRRLGDYLLKNNKIMLL